MNDSQERKSDREELKACAVKEREILKDLRQLLEEQPTIQSRQSILTILDRLRLNLSRHFDLACEKGYMSGVRKERPNWDRQIKALQSDNLGCISTLEKLQDHIKLESASATIVSQESDDLNTWLHSLATLRRGERRLLQSAFTLDIGGEA